MRCYPKRLYELIRLYVNCKKFQGKESYRVLSPQHYLIRFLEFILHLGYTFEVRNWQIRAENYKIADLKKKESIQNAFWSKLGLCEDMSKVGGFGSTNDGNTAR